MPLSILGGTIIFGIAPIPLGIAIDGGTGSWWKPDIYEKGVTQQDFDNFTYSVNYTGCPDKKSTTIDNKEKISQLEMLYQKGLLTQDELEKEK